MSLPRTRFAVMPITIGTMAGWAVVAVLIVPVGLLMGWHLANQVTQGSLIGMTLTMPLLLAGQFVDQVWDIAVLQGGWIGLILLSGLSRAGWSVGPKTGLLRGLAFSVPGAVWFALLGTGEGRLGPLQGLAVLIAGAVGGFVVAVTWPRPR